VILNEVNITNIFAGKKVEDENLFKANGVLPTANKFVKKFADLSCNLEFYLLAKLISEFSCASNFLLGKKSLVKSTLGVVVQQIKCQPTQIRMLVLEMNIRVRKQYCWPFKRDL